MSQFSPSSPAASNPAKAYILALDLCLGACIVALGNHKGEVMASRQILMARGHQEAIAPLIQDTLKQAAVSFSDLGRIAVTLGPGSFSGVRLGLIFGKSLALSLGIDCIGLSLFDVFMAEDNQASNQASNPASGWTVVVIPKGQDGYYTQSFYQGKALDLPRLATRLELLEAFKTIGPRGRLKWIGPGALDMEGLDIDGVVAPSKSAVMDFPSPETLLRLGLQADKPQGPLRPLYLQSPKARTLAERLSTPLP